MLILPVEKIWGDRKMNLYIGKRIRQCREERGMKQEDLAEKTNLSVTYIGMIERGERLPRLNKFIEIANALKVTSELLLSDVLTTGYNVIWFICYLLTFGSQFFYWQFPVSLGEEFIFYFSF